MSKTKSKRPLGLYDADNNLIKTFANQVELAAEFNKHKCTINKYVKSKKLFLEKYYIRELNK